MTGTMTSMLGGQTVIMQGIETIIMCLGFLVGLLLVIVFSQGLRNST